MANKYTEVTTLDKVEPKINQVEKFKVQSNKKYRIGFPLLSEDGKIIINKVYYFNKFEEGQNGIKVKAIVPSDCSDEDLEQLEGVLGEPIYRYVTVIIEYVTDSNGVVQKPFQYRLVPFVFSDFLLADLRAINDEFPLEKHDLLVQLKEGTDPKFQNLSLFPTSKEAIWRNDKIRDRIMEEAKKVAESMVEAVASKMPCSELKKRAKLTSNKSADDADSATPPNDVSVVDDIDVDDLV